MFPSEVFLRTVFPRAVIPRFVPLETMGLMNGNANLRLSRR